MAVVETFREKLVHRPVRWACISSFRGALVRVRVALPGIVLAEK